MTVTREQEARAEAMAGLFDSVEVRKPTTQGAPIDSVELVARKGSSVQRAIITADGLPLRCGGRR